jgi:hypothetical protein
MSRRLLLGLVCLGSLGAMTARAEPSPYLGRDNPLLSLLPSAPALSAHERGRREQAIARALSRLAHVQRAEVLITQQEPSATPLDLPPPEYHVQVKLALNAPGPSELEVERVVRGVLPALAPGHLRVMSRVPRPAPEVASTLTRVGPFVVARESSATLRATLAACLAVNALLAILLLSRRRRGAAR